MTPMLRSTWILIAVLASLAPASAASARSRDALRGAKLQAVAGMLSITETRCPQGSSACGKATLDEKFDASRPRTRSAEGRTGFPMGARIAGRGSGQCYAESPPETFTGPDGSVQFLGSAARVTPGKFHSTRIVASTSKRGVRIAWLEPLTPGITCDYFGEPDTSLEVPAAQKLADALVSPLIGTRALKRSRFSVTIAGSQEWNDPAADGTQIAGRASWRLKLTYVR
jgi:hypothetical protein